MTFSEFAKFIKSFYEEKTTVAEFVKNIIDAILDDVALEKDFSNPLYKLKKSTLEAYYNGTLPISQNNAAAIAPRIDEAKFEDFINNYSVDALEQMRNKLAEFNFDVDSNDVGIACANILSQIIINRAQGKTDDIKSLNYKRNSSGRLLKNISPATIERRDNKLHIAGEVITIHQELIPDSVAENELNYIRAILDAYAQKLDLKQVSLEDINALPLRYREMYKEQRKAYYSAISIEHSIRDIFDDGEDEFKNIKDDAWHGISETYWKEYSDGYERLIAVLEKVTSTTLDKSVLNQIRNLIGNLEKKGICHILVNEGTIKSWVDIDGE